jgi:hypothetical protein
MKPKGLTETHADAAGKTRLTLQGLGADMALLTAINYALDVPADQLTVRVTLVRSYLRYALDTLPDTRRSATLRVIAGMIARDIEG